MFNFDVRNPETSTRNKQRIVIKVGSSLLTGRDHLTPRYAFMHGLPKDVADLQNQGYEVVLTSSGSADFDARLSTSCTGVRIRHCPGSGHSE